MKINTKDISIATEILAMEFSKNMFNSKKMKELLKERDLVYSGDEYTINKVITEYGKELREEVRNNGK
ncbi:MAG TPA: hypothetical protein IAD08_06320 [Candidatus Scatovivens faecipullorum]|jgi:hypothetical protein|nr:hypothetical protein [Candidatus Scatovivens faecipullorum]